MATTTLEQCDAHGNKHAFKYTIDADGVTLIPMAVTSGSTGGSSSPEVIITPSLPYIETIPSADTVIHTYAAQAVKTPVFVKAAKTMTGFVTIADLTRLAGIPLYAGDSAIVHVQNLNQLRYTFSVNAATEKFSVSAGI